MLGLGCGREQVDRFEEVYRKRWRRGAGVIVVQGIGLPCETRTGCTVCPVMMIYLLCAPCMCVELHEGTRQGLAGMGQASRHRQARCGWQVAGDPGSWRGNFVLVNT